MLISPSPKPRRRKGRRRGSISLASDEYFLFMLSPDSIGLRLVRFYGLFLLPQNNVSLSSFYVYRIFAYLLWDILHSRETDRQVSPAPFRKYADDDPETKEAHIVGNIHV